MQTAGKGSDEKKRMAAALKASAAGHNSDDSADAKHDGKNKSRKTDGPPLAADADDSMAEGSSDYVTSAQFSAFMTTLTNHRAEDIRHREEEVRHRDTMSQMLVSFENRFTVSDAHLARVDDTLAQLKARLDAFDKLAPPAGGTGSSGSASAADKRWAPPPAAGSRSPSRSSPAAVPDYFKVFFVGADYALSRAALGRYWNDTIKPLVGVPLTSDSRPFIGDNAAFSIGFLTEAAAKDFIAALEAVVVPPLVDPDDHSHSFKFHLQRSKVPTKFGRQLSYLHQHYHNKLCDRDGYGTDFKLATDAHRGRVYLTRGERLFMLHSVNTDGVTLRSYEEGINEFKLDLAESRAAAQLFAAA